VFPTTRWCISCVKPVNKPLRQIIRLRHLHDLCEWKGATPSTTTEINPVACKSRADEPLMPTVGWLKAAQASTYVECFTRETFATRNPIHSVVKVRKPCPRRSASCLDLIGKDIANLFAPKGEVSHSV
jgi:hypothetical protein